MTNDELWDKLLKSLDDGPSAHSELLEKHRREQEERDAAAAASQKLYEESRDEELAAPVFARPSWETFFAVRGRELTALGFQRFLYLHNATLTAAGRPNCSIVYLSPDRTIEASLYCRLRPRDQYQREKPGVRDPLLETRSLGFSSIYAGPRWILTTTSSMPGDFHPPEVLFNSVPYDATAEELLDRHREFLSAPPWNEELAVPWESPAQHFERDVALHRLLVAASGRFSEQLRVSQAAWDEKMTKMREEGRQRREALVANLKKRRDEQDAAGQSEKEQG